MSGRRSPARAPRRAGAAAALLTACLAVVAAAGCAGSRADGEALEGRPLVPADPPLAVPGVATSYEDLPGVAGFDALTPGLRERVLDRANRTLCDCGCVGHVVARCLHDAEGCSIAVRLATGFVDDALALQLQAGFAAAESAAPVAEDPSGEPPPGGAAAVASDAAAPAAAGEDAAAAAPVAPAPLGEWPPGTAPGPVTEGATEGATAGATSVPPGSGREDGTEPDPPAEAAPH